MASCLARGCPKRLRRSTPSASAPASRSATCSTPATAIFIPSCSSMHSNPANTRPSFGSVTGEHGSGLEKRENIRYVFSDDDLEVMDRVRRVFDPQRLMNPGKVFPGEGLEPSHLPLPPGYPRRQPRAGVAAGDALWV